MANFGSFAELAKAFDSRAKEVEKAMTAATKQHTEAIYKRGKDIMRDDIYGIPIDTTNYSFKRSKGGGFKLGKDGKRVSYVNTPKQAAALRRKGMAGDAGRGAAKWERTGHLQANERMEMKGVVGYITNPQVYATARHDLGLQPGSQDAVAGSRKRSDRIAPWRKRAIREQEVNRLQRYRESMMKVLITTR